MTQKQISIETLKTLIGLAIILPILGIDIISIIKAMSAVIFTWLIFRCIDYLNNPKVEQSTPSVIDEA
jgi:hypothetical protein